VSRCKAYVGSVCALSQCHSIQNIDTQYVIPKITCVYFSRPTDAFNDVALHECQICLYQLALQGCTTQAALQRQDLSCLYLAHHELQSVLIILSLLFIYTLPSSLYCILLYLTICIAYHYCCSYCHQARVCVGTPARRLQHKLVQ